MATAAIVLKPTRTEKLPRCSHLWIHQIEDGTIFYHTNVSPDKLYVVRQGKEVACKLPCQVYHDDDIDAYKNEIYIQSLKKIYKAVFNTSNSRIQFLEVRPKMEDEQYGGNDEFKHIRHERGLVISRVREGTKYVYNMWDNPDEDGILFDLSDEERKKLRLLCVHRGKVIFFSENEGNISPTVRELRENVIVVDAKCAPYVYARDPNRFVYITCFDKNVYTLDTETVKLLPSLEILGCEPFCSHPVAGINNGVISVNFYKTGGERFLVSAQLPDGYYENPNSALQKAEERIKEIEATPLWHLTNDRLQTMGMPQFTFGEAIVEPAAIVLAAVASLCYGLFGLLLVVLTVLVQSPRPSVNRPVVCRCGNQAPVAQAQAVATTSVANPQSPTSKYPWWFPGKVNANVNLNTTAYFE